jgi:hypothetical protein
LDATRSQPLTGTPASAPDREAPRRHLDTLLRRRNPRRGRTVFPYDHEYLRPKTPGGRGFLVDRAGVEAGTQPGQALMTGSSNEFVEKPSMSTTNSA